MNRIILAGAAGIVAVGAVSASAASLGGVNTDSVGVESSVVASCDTDGIIVDYSVAYAATPATYRVATVDMSGVATTCNSLAYRITLNGAGGVSLGESTGTVTLTGNAMSVNVASLEVDGESVTGVALAIVG